MGGGPPILTTDQGGTTTVCTGDIAQTTFRYAMCSCESPTGTDELFTDSFDLSSSTNSMFAKDIDGNGTADVLYLQSYYERGWFICEPGGSPYIDDHFSFGTSSGSYGMGFDATGNTLWLFDDDTKEIVRVE